MKTRRILCAAVIAAIACGSADAQNILGRLANRARDAAENAVGNKIENAIYDAIDNVGNEEEAQAEEAPKPAPKKAEPAPAAAAGWTCPECGAAGNTGKFCAECGAKKPEQTDGTWTCAECGAKGNTGKFCAECGAKKPVAGAVAVAAVAEPVKKKAEAAYAKSDFVPGDEIIFDDDFAEEQLGEFPSKWDIDGGNAEVATLDGRKVLMGVGYHAIVMPLMKNPNDYLSEAFTLEFDFYLGNKDEYSLGVSLDFYNSEGGSIGYWSVSPRDQFNWLLYKPTGGETGGVKWWSDAENEDLLNFNDWNHIAISFNKRAFKAYINGTRITSVPNMSAPKYVKFGLRPAEDTEYNGISNVRIANGAVPLYDRLATDGKIITYAITFETGKADIKPESFVEINRIAKLMQENPNISFEVQGHCDASGSDKVNDPLSQKRAEAIVAALVEQGIAQARLTAVGKGSHEPIASNSTDEGRAKNRRVEFVKK